MDVRLAVGQEDHDAADLLLRLELGEPGHRELEARADRRAVLFLRREVELVRGRREVPVVERQRAPRIGVVRERDQADRIVGSPVEAGATEHELLEHLLDRVEPGELLVALREIERPHRARDVDRHHDRDAIAADAGGLVTGAWPGEGDRERDDAEPDQHVGEPREPRPPGLATGR